MNTYWGRKSTILINTTMGVKRIANGVILNLMEDMIFFVRVNLKLFKCGVISNPNMCYFEPSCFISISSSTNKTSSDLPRDDVYKSSPREQVYTIAVLCVACRILFYSTGGGAYTRYSPTLRRS